MSGIWLVIIAAYVVLVYFGRAQLEAKRKARGGQGGGAAPDAAAREALRLELQQQVEAAQGYRVVLQEQPAGAPDRFAARVVPEEDAPDEVPVDYDAESISVADARRSAAESPAFLPEGTSGTTRGMTPAQRTPPVSSVAPRIESRIVDRMVVAPSAQPPTAGAGATPSGAAVAPSPAAERMARFAGGGLRGAFVLSEIFGPPTAER